MDFTDEDGYGPVRGRLLAYKISSEAVVLLDAAFEELAERRQAAEFGGIGPGLGSQGSVRRETSYDNESAGDHSTFRFSFRMSVDHLVSSLSTSAVYSSALEVSGSPPSR